MVTPTGPLSLIPLPTGYWDYFSRDETKNFCGCYDDVLAPYTINPSNAAAVVTLANVARLIYDAAQEGVPTTLLE